MKNLPIILLHLKINLIFTFALIKGISPDAPFFNMLIGSKRLV